MAIILFGACDRHNLGDLLFPHVAAALIARKAPLIAGIGARDMSAFGGHRVQALARVAADLGDETAHLIQVGGEIFTCEAWQAAVMLLPEDQARVAITAYGHESPERRRWVHGMVGYAAEAPYVAPTRLFARPGRRAFVGVGGVELDRAPAALRAEVLAALRGADFVGVRERVTLGLLEAAGVDACLMPDPAVLVRELFGRDIAAHGETGEPREVREAFPQGYLAVQCAAEFGDDATLGLLAAQIDRIAAASGLGIVLFRAGAAPWHDSMEVYKRLAGMMASEHVALFESLHIWDICALIEHARAFVGSSLHARIVAGAYARPRATVLPPGARVPNKLGAYIQSWEPAQAPGVVPLRDLAPALGRALAGDAMRLLEHAQRVAETYRQEFETVAARLGNVAPPVPYPRLSSEAQTTLVLPRRT
jgi:hypothetical protein